MLIKAMFAAVFPFVYSLILIVLLWQAFRVMAKGFLAVNELEKQKKKLTQDRTGKFTVHPELIDEDGKITDEDLLTIRFSNDLDPPKPTEPSSEEKM